MVIQNKQIKQYAFLTGMYGDDYFPNHLVKKIEDILYILCKQIEQTQPKEIKELYVLTHDSVEKINNLMDEFEEAGSELETGARESIGEDFDFILKTYGFDLDADAFEKAIENREW